MALAMAYTIIRGDVPFTTDYLAVEILAGFALGAAGLHLSGLPLKSVFNGDIAELMGQDTRSHIKARAFQTSVAPLLEEYTYRVAPFIYGTIALSAAAQIVFVLRHYLLRGGNELKLGRPFYTRLSLSVIYLLSYLLTGSILTAVLAHYIHNAPTLYIEYQRYIISGENDNAK